MTNRLRALNHDYLNALIRDSAPSVLNRRAAQGRPWAKGERRIYRAPLPYSSSRTAPARRRADLVAAAQFNIDPMLTAFALWAQTRPALAQPTSAINGAIDGRFDKSKPILAAGTP